MNKTKAFAWLPLLAACAVSPAGLAAPCAGTNINSTQTWSPSEIVKGARGLSILRIASVIVSDDPNAPFHLASGECVGSLFLGAEGKPVSGSGLCVRKDKDGDAVYEEWTVISAGKGTSKVAGGTGKFANASWTFSWQVTQLHRPLAAVRWSGDCR